MLKKKETSINPRPGSEFSQFSPVSGFGKSDAGLRNKEKALHWKHYSKPLKGTPKTVVKGNHWGFPNDYLGSVGEKINYIEYI